jgi:KDO2-lipid IV(A) lauroyltransferase
MRVLSKKRYGVAIKNLKIAFGDALAAEERERIARESFRHFGMFMIEAMKFPFYRPEAVERLMDVDAEGAEVFRTMMEEKRKGLIVVTGHLGNFEMLAHWGRSRNHEIIALMREARDRGTTELMAQMRERMGIQLLSLRQSLKPAISGLQRNAIVAIVCDQNAADVFVPFFGHPTGTAEGPARIALMTGAPIWFLFTVRIGGGRYRVIGEGPYWAENTDDMKRDVERIMTEANLQIEKAIRQYPEQWLWFHDRWRSSPAVRELEESVTPA